MTTIRILRNTVWLLLGAALLASCSKDDTEPGGPLIPGEGGDIIFEIGFAPTGGAAYAMDGDGKLTPQPQTRVATDELFRSEWEDGDRIGLFAVRRLSSGATGALASDGTNYMNNVALTYNSANGGSWSGKAYWPTDAAGGVLDFYAYYPYDDKGGNPQDLDPTAIVFNVATDQNGTTTVDGADHPNYNLSDLLTAVDDNGGKGYSKAEYGATPIRLTFSHALAMVQVTLDPVGLGGQADDFTVELRGVSRSSTLDLGAAGGPVAVTRGAQEARINMYRLPDNADGLKFRALVPAQTVAAGTRLYRITAGNEQFQSGALSGNLELKAGEAEIFTQRPAYGNYAVLIKDATFRQYCLDKFDTDGDGRLSLDEILAVTDIDVNSGYQGTRITTLEGIENFTNLQTLYCSFNSLEKLDVSGCEQLQTLDCRNNYFIKELNVSGCGQLQTLECNDNFSLVKLNVSGCEQLQTLYCNSNRLEELDVSGYGQLQTLSCYDNRLEELDITANTLLTQLICGDDKTELTVWTTPAQELASSQTPGKLYLTVCHRLSETAVTHLVLAQKNVTLNHVTVKDKP